MAYKSTWVLVLAATGTVVFAGGRSGSAGAVVYPIPGFSNCPLAGNTLTTRFPPITVPVSIPMKPYSLTYGPLELHWGSVAPAGGAVCSVQSDRGVLPVLLDLPLVGSKPLADSVATAQVDFMSPRFTAPAVCDWQQVTRNCSLNGNGPLMIRWSTSGFDEQVAGHSVYNSGPLTYYAHVSSADVSAGLQPAELYIHRTLIAHLPEIDWLTVVQEPPADVQVRDASGRVTGRTRSGTTADQMPDSLYITNGHGYAAVVLLASAREPYTATAIGSPGHSYSISISSLSTSGDGAAGVIAESTTGVLPASGAFGLTFTPSVKELPRITRHRTVAVRTSRTQGARVRYTAPRAEDGAGRRVPVRCSPRPGHRFAIGTTIVRCSARDPLGPIAHSTFKIIVKRRRG